MASWINKILVFQSIKLLKLLTQKGRDRVTVYVLIPMYSKSFNNPNFHCIYIYNR
jgi:hypothetical protein